MRHPLPLRRASLLALALLALSTACGGAGAGGGGGWYYHWSCNGDPECLITNPTGAPSGTVGPEPGGCGSLMTFGSHFWGIPPATQSCDQSPNTPLPPLTYVSVDPST
ncbi:MAG TPA: hypothetical protein VFP50_03040, partial [Anaeromyxobacteraceae bacterium]|nr:hypothetical protein [Anaeromyxobacteraceae bacterium]